MWINRKYADCNGTGLCYRRTKKNIYILDKETICNFQCKLRSCNNCQKKHPEWHYNCFTSGFCYECNKTIYEDERNSDEDDLHSDASFDTYESEVKNDSKPEALSKLRKSKGIEVDSDDEIEAEAEESVLEIDMDAIQYDVEGSMKSTLSSLSLVLPLSAPSSPSSLNSPMCAYTPYEINTTRKIVSPLTPLKRRSKKRG